ncbi:MAG: nucleotidyl transferase AbiEii/AbiGii toxin family protein [Elusimicrobia bacterium]|jgi:predicted nucleotidyltransferase component of viral defense system|nr:nucleotidyl transferase AbiEii/AbiGii toxin family protein [Elusimicrobiota bacterium]
MDPSFRVRELFHLHALRQLASRLALRPYAVKGGICLRFFHRSPRLSEDMDIDVSPRLPVRTLRHAVDHILGGPALTAGLRPQGVIGLQFSAPKQTETTQRWKILLTVMGGTRLSTRLEFSRRTPDIAADRATPTPEILEMAFLPPFVAAHYGPKEMIAQKIRALGSPSRVAARDLFDLHHLYSQFPRTPFQKFDDLTSEERERAVNKANGFSLGDFREQVLPFLPEDLETLYGNPAGFQMMKETVERHLAESL